MPAKSDFVCRCEPIAFFLTWTTYGSWLPGDARGWTDGQGHVRSAQPLRRRHARRHMAEPTLSLDHDQQVAVAAVIRSHCRVRGWALHALNCRTQHVHVVVTASGVGPDAVLTQLKIWASRRLKAMAMARAGRCVRTKWWTEGGSKRWVYDQEDLEAIMEYVAECQDQPRESR